MARDSSPLTHVRGVVIALPWVLYLFIADIALSLLLPLRLLSPKLVYELSSLIAASVWAWIQLIFESFNGARIKCTGDALPRGESAIVVANHVAWADFYMIQALAKKAGMLGYCRYFVKSQLRFVPFLGWGFWAMGMPMISRNWLKDRSELARAFSDIVDEKFPTWLISYSEGTRFSMEKYEESKAWCKEADKQQPSYLLYPRTKGFVATVQHLRKTDHVKAVYDLTIAYHGGGVFQQSPSMWETLSLPSLTEKRRFNFCVHARRYPIASLPATDEALANWLEQRWQEKGEWLDSTLADWRLDATS